MCKSQAVPKRSTPITAAQRRRLEELTKKIERLEDEIGPLKAERDAEIMKARKAEVSVRVLADITGLHPSRIGQISKGN